MSKNGYHNTRLPFDPRRETLWRALWKFYFSSQIRSSNCVLELGCGYAHFINNVIARRRIAVDNWPGFVAHLSPGVEGRVGSVVDLGFLEDHSVDFAFASNLFEHLSKEDFGTTLHELRKKLTATGKLAILQPNYRYAYKEYFDDYTHVTVYSHESMCDFLGSNDYQVVECRPRFMPLTVKDRRMPIWEPLIALYIKSPLKPLGKQMLIVAQPRERVRE